VCKNTKITIFQNQGALSPHPNDVPGFLLVAYLPIIHAGNSVKSNTGGSRHDEAVDEVQCDVLFECRDVDVSLTCMGVREEQLVDNNEATCIDHKASKQFKLK